MQRNTQQRDAIRKAIREADRPLTAQEVLHAAQRHCPDLGLATIYRTLNALRDEKLLTAVELPGSAIRYEESATSAHHHFFCRTCERMLKLPGTHASLRSLVPKGFRAEHCELTVFGRCPDCSKPRRRPTRQSGARKKAARPRSRPR